MADNSAIETINGTDLVLLVNTGVDAWQAVAHATAHSLEVTRNTRPVSSKTTGDVELSEYGKYTWSGSVDALMTFASGVSNYESLLDMQLVRTKVKIISVLNSPLPANIADQPLDATKLDYDPTATAVADNPFTDGSSYYEGTALITSLSKTATDGDTVTFSMSFSAASSLAKKTVATVIT